jgi:hypothetical protein
LLVVGVSVPREWVQRKRPADFSVAKATFTLDVGDAPLAFQLDAKGPGVNQRGTVKLSYNKKTAMWTFAGKLKGDLQAAWTEHGLTNQIIINGELTIPVLLTLQANTTAVLDANPSLSYTDKAGTLGVATYVPVN